MLYPFLYAGGSGLDTLMEDVRRSTLEKANDIVRLRETVLHRYGGELAVCAARMAAAFRSGGRLFAFGNGGSSTDAQDVAALFLNPGGPARPLPALALTTSGNSDNLIAALREATRRGMVTVGLAGSTGGQMADTPGLHHLFVVPSSSVHRIQEAQTTVYHVLWELTQAELAREAR